METNAIDIINLEKVYTDQKALDGISFEVKENEIFGMVGPDGAGKTTTIRILCGLLNATSGTANILGHNISKERGIIKNLIGYLSQKFSLYTDLSVDENIAFIAKIHGVKDFKKRRDELLAFMRLTAFRGFLAGRLSGGMKQKLALACALIHKPKILFLDEPTTGVDPVSRRDFWKILSELLNENLTIIISTPYLDEAERFSRIVMLSDGRLLRYGSPDEIKAEITCPILEIVSTEVRNASNLIREKTEFEVQMFGDRFDVVINDYETDYPVIKKVLDENSVPIIDNRIKPVSLENVFIKILKGKNK